MADYELEEGQVHDGFAHVAWMGGSLSPPTKAHYDVAKAMGKTLSDKNPGKMCAVVIVPVSPGYPKKSVEEACIPNAARIRLAEALVAALDSENGNPNLRFFISKHEFVSPVAVPTVDSVGTVERAFPGATVYIAQGLDNIEAIFKRKWARSDELLTRGFIVYPRGDKETLAVLREALQSPQAGSKEGKFPPVDRVEDREEILRRVVIVPVEFNDDTSSSLLRKRIREGGDVRSLFHPAVYAEYTALKHDIPSMYATDICEEKPAAAGGAGGGGAAGGAGGGGAAGGISSSIIIPTGISTGGSAIFGMKKHTSTLKKRRTRRKTNRKNRRTRNHRAIRR